ncbi:MAG: hypothetical protein IT392_06640 [Nitrospirae bacterium]|nr:hypothetical protein [Nitrospirota bacterium]
MSDNDKTDGTAFESPDSSLRHQITCSKCGMVYEMRYLSETCRMADGEGYLCMNCNTVLELEQ